MPVTLTPSATPVYRSMAGTPTVYGEPGIMPLSFGFGKWFPGMATT